MNRQQTAMLLSVASAYDKRTIGESDVIAWAENLDDIGFEEARDAVKRYYRTEDKPVTVAKVRDLVSKARSEAESQERREVMSRGMSDPARHCGIQACRCTHTHCMHGLLDELVEYTAEGFDSKTKPGIPGVVYERSPWCPECWKVRTR